MPCKGSIETNFELYISETFSNTCVTKWYASMMKFKKHDL